MLFKGKPMMVWCNNRSFSVPSIRRARVLRDPFWMNNFVLKWWDIVGDAAQSCMRSRYFHILRAVMSEQLCIRRIRDFKEGIAQAVIASCMTGGITVGTGIIQHWSALSAALGASAVNGTA